jgi:type III pantothenate kinase
MVFAGGRIAPGVVLMRDSLVTGTASLPKADGDYSTMPTDTMTAIVTGIIDAQLGLIERGMKSMTQLGFDPVLVLAGGAASRFAPYLKREFPEMIQKHNLVLRGLALRAQNEG